MSYGIAKELDSSILNIPLKFVKLLGKEGTNKNQKFSTIQKTFTMIYECLVMGQRKKKCQMISYHFIILNINSRNFDFYHSHLKIQYFYLLW